MGKMINTNVSITPGDSIVIKKDADGNVVFSGKGSENCRIWNEYFKYQSLMEENPSIGDSIFNTLLHKYASQMSPFWKESFQLSFKYWSTYKALDFCMQNESKIKWEQEPFQSAIPFMDYVYLPQYYAEFMNLYCDYRINELHNDIFLNGKRFDSDNLLAKYYFQKEFFSGYPKYLLLSETIQELTKTKDPSDFQNTYQDFIAECKDPDLLKIVTQEYEYLLKTQPGKNIRDLSLTIEKELPLKKTADGYILIAMGYNDISNNLIKSMDSLNNAGLNTNVQVIYPERYKISMGNDNNNHFFVTANKELGEDLLKLRCKTYYLLLIRNDGTIVAKNIKDWYEEPAMNKGKWTFETEKIISLIKDDLKQNKKSGFDFSIFFIVLGTIFLSGGIAYIVYSARVKTIKKKEENKRLITELELKAIRSQMNPHFIFNALSSIQHLINKQNNSEANQYLLNFSKLLRMVLATSEKKLLPLSDEIEQLKLYMQLEQLRTPFDYRIEIDDGIQPANEEIPGMLLQPIVENAIKHGISDRQGSVITLKFSKEENVLLAEITDDGIGCVSSQALIKGFGLRATEERLSLINEEYKANIGIRMENNHPTGTKVVISIPV